ncbi:MAG: sigma-70 family RNA polymerase sigma factor [Myxococcota bacterium]
MTASPRPDEPTPIRAVSAEGDPGVAFDARDYGALRRALSRAVKRACPVWMREHREDVVQIAMTKVVAVMDAGKPAEEIRMSYIARVAYHAVVDEMRRQRRRRTLSTVELDDTAEPLRGGAPTPETNAANRQLGGEIRDCFGRMARSRRLAVALYLEGRGATEIATMLDWKRKQADNLVYRGLSDLRRCLTDKGISP